MAEKGHIEALRFIHSSVTSPQWYQLLQRCDRWHKPPLHLAAEKGCIAILKFIKDTQTSDQWYNLLQLQSRSSDTPLHLAVDSKCLETTNLIKDTLDADQWYNLLQIQNNLYGTPLHNAVSAKSKEMVKLIKDTMTADQWYNLLQIQNNLSGTTLHQAVAGNSREMVKLIKDTVNADQWYNLLQIQHKRQGTPLHKAVSGNSQEMVKLIKDTVNADQWYNLLQIENYSSGTPLHKAVSGNSQEMVKLIKDTVNADQWYSLLQIQHKRQGTPLHKAVSGNSLEMVELIKDSVNADRWYSLLQIRHRLFDTPLCMAVRRVDQEIAELIKMTVTTDQWYELTLLVVKSMSWLRYNRITNHKLLKDIRYILLSITATQQAAMIRNLTTNGTVPSFLTKIMRDDIIENKVWIDLLSSLLSDAVRATFYLLLRNKSTSDLADIAIATADKTGNTCYNLAKQNFLLHVLAQNGDICRIKQLMYRLSDKQRAHLVRLEDANKKIPYQMSASLKVKTLLQWTKAQEGFYLLYTPPAILIMYTTEEREAAQEEYEQLKEVLPQFNVNTTAKKDLTRKGMMLAIREVQEQTATLSAMIVIIMTHGHRGAVQASDGPININQLMLTMNSPKLDGKPKVLLIQACQNKTTQIPDISSSNDSLCQDREQSGPVTKYDARSSNVTDTHFDIQYPDTMVLMATVNGSRAERNMMIPLFAENLSRSGEHEDLYEVFLKTNRDIRAQTSDQVAEFRSTLQYKLSLRNVFDPDAQNKLSLRKRIAKFFTRP